VLTARLEIVFAGRRTADQESLLQKLSQTQVNVVLHPYLDHARAIDLLYTADLLCVLLSSDSGADRVVPAKVFEYMASRRPILAIAPAGDLSEILSKYPWSTHFVPGDPAAIADFLECQILQHGRETRAVTEDWRADQFSRRNQALQLSMILSAVAAKTATKV
jgi:hypothetical protein